MAVKESRVCSPASVKPREVSSTKALTCWVCLELESGDWKVILGLVTRSRVFMRITTMLSQTAGEAPLP